MSQRGGTLARDQVIATFWPEGDSSHARNNLRQTLSFLRDCLGADAVVGTGSHGVAVATSVVCDAVRFEALLDANRKEEALKIYGGELLPGFYLDGSHAFADWLDARRRHFGLRAAKAAWDLTAECETRAEQASAAFWGKRALALSPFSESEVQRVLRLLVRVGDLAGALRAFHGLQKSLEAEFGAAPSEETARLAAEITTQLRSAGEQVPTLLGPRRTETERRLAPRRRSQNKWKGVERRSVRERREGQRRSGVDRRE